MKKITIGITLSKEFESCQQWSQNRAWQKDNPNKSRDNLNFTYAMSEDDEMFFKEYSETVVAEVAVDDLFKLFRKHTRRCFTEDYEFDYDNDFAKFNYVVTNNFSAKALHILLFQYIKYRILYYWYWEKNMYEDLQYVELELEKLSERIKAMVINEAQADDEDTDGEPLDIVPYNDGFVINPPRKPRQYPTTEDDTEEIGIEINIPEPEPETEEVWFFVKNLPNKTEVETTGDNIPLNVVISRRRNATYRDYEYIKVVLYKGDSVLKSSLIPKLRVPPINILINEAYTDDDVYYFKLYLQMADSSETEILESNHCEVSLKQQGIYTEEYDGQYS